MGKRRPKSYRVHLTWEALQRIARLLLVDEPLAALVNKDGLCKSSALYRTNTGRYTAHLVFRDGDQSTSITIRNIEVAP